MANFWSRPFLVLAGLLLVIASSANFLVYLQGAKAIRQAGDRHLDDDLDRASAISERSIAAFMENMDLWARRGVMVRILDDDVDNEITDLLDTTMEQFRFLDRLSCITISGRLLAASGVRAPEAGIEFDGMELTAGGANSAIRWAGGSVVVTVPIIWQFDETELLGFLNAWMDPRIFLENSPQWWSAISSQSGQILTSLGPDLPDQVDLARPDEVFDGFSRVLKISRKISFPQGVASPHWMIVVAALERDLYQPMPVFRLMTAAMTAGSAILILTFLVAFTRRQSQLLDQITNHAHQLEGSTKALQAEIGEREKAELAVRENEARFRALTENTDDVTFILSREGVITYTSPSLNGFGYEPSEIVGVKPEEFIHPDDLITVQKCAKTAIQNRGETIDLPVFRFRHQDQTWRYMEGVLTCLFGLPGVDGVAVNCRDISDRQRMEDELEKAKRLEALGLLAGGIAHDFNNILTVLFANLTLARSMVKPTDRIYQQLLDAEKATKRTTSLTAQLLTFSKGGSPIKETATISELVKDTALFSLRGSNVKCEIDLAADLWPVDVDIGQISQVVQNLVINADQAMPAGDTLVIRGRNVNLEGNQIQPLLPGRYIELSFVDHGQGIKAADLERIFDPYFTTKAEGSGLGLATTYSVINRHDGVITVESDGESGTTFTVYLPASDKSPVKEASGPHLPVRSPGDERCRRVLLMDDQPDIRKIGSRMLNALGYDAQTARDGDEVIEIYRREFDADRRFDVVIMDLTVPGGMGGGAAIAELLAIDPEVKAVVSSGYADDPFMADFKRHGFCDVIRKPYDFEHFAKVLARIDYS